MASSSFSHRLHRWLVTKGEPTEPCPSLSDAACEAVPGNFLLLLVARTASKLADRLANPKTSLTWILQALGAPTLFGPLIVTIRESGALLPQVLLAAHIRRFARRKWAWVLGSLLQAGAIIGCALTTQTLRGTVAGLAMLGCIVLFSLSRAIGSIAAKDILGRTMPKGQRGQLTGWASSASGLIAIGVGLGLLRPSEGEDSILLYTGFLLGAALLWAVAAGVHARVVEFPGETEDPGEVWADTRQRLGLLRRERDFRRFVIIRALAVGSGLSAPLIVGLAHNRLGGAALWLGIFIVADGIAGMVASPLWGRLADRSSRDVLRLAMALTAALLVMIGAMGIFELPASVDRVAFPALFFCLGIAHSGVRLGRKTYLVDMAEGNRRTDYVATSNTVIGLLLLFAGAATSALSLLSIPLALAALAACAATGAVLGGRLPQVSG